MHRQGAAPSLTDRAREAAGGVNGGGEIYPEFVPAHSGNITAALGKTALLNCRVTGVGNKTVRCLEKLAIVV